MKIHSLIKLVIIICSVFCNNSYSEEKPYRIAAILPLTGQLASLGQYVKNGLELSYNDIPLELKNKIEIIYEDDQFNPNKTLSAYRHLRSLKKIDAVFVLGSPTANALVPITEKEQVLLMAIGASDPSIAVGRKYSFIHWVTPQVLAEKLTTEIIRRNLKKIAFVTAEVSGTIADTTAATKSLSDKGLSSSIIYNQNFSKETTDYRSALLKIKEKEADAIVAVLFPGALSSFAKQLRDFKIKAELIGMETFEDEAEVKTADGALLNAWYVNASEASKDFISNYQKIYKQFPGWGASNGYDSLQLFYSALKTTTGNNEEIRTYLSSLKNYSGACGSYSASGDNRFTLPADLKRVTSGGFEKID